MGAQQIVLPGSADGTDSPHGECPSFASTVTIYTDGGCDPNPGPGGWAAVLLFRDREVVLSGNDPHTTNNQMELEAAIRALTYLDGLFRSGEGVPSGSPGGPRQIDLYTDSTYLRHGIDRWIEGWLARGWRTKNGRSVKNQAQWRKLHALNQAYPIEWHWVKGHIGDPQNERVDRLARDARSRLPGSRAPTAAPPSPPDASPAASAGDGTPHVEISIGVSCTGSNGPGRWVAILRSGQERKVLSERRDGTTGNILHLRAALAGLTALKTPSSVTVYTVSDYLGRGASEWVQDWQRRGWRTRQGADVKNRELWEALVKAARSHHVTWKVTSRRAAAGGTPREPFLADLAEAKELASRQAADARRRSQAG